jgi:hypothetical protein
MKRPVQHIQHHEKTIVRAQPPIWPENTLTWAWGQHILAPPVLRTAWPGSERVERVGRIHSDGIWCSRPLGCTIDDVSVRRHVRTSKNIDRGRRRLHYCVRMCRSRIAASVAKRHFDMEHIYLCLAARVDLAPDCSLVNDRPCFSLRTASPSCKILL